MAKKSIIEQEVIEQEVIETVEETTVQEAVNVPLNEPQPEVLQVGHPTRAFRS